MVRVVTAGHVNWDVTLEVDRLPGPDDEALISDQHRGGGGSAANVAAALAALDVPAGVVGCVGDDEPGTFVREELAAVGVDCSGIAVRGGATTVKYLLVAADGSVAVLGNEGLNEALQPDDVARHRIAGAEHLHLTNQPPATAAALAELADDAGLSISFDPGRRAGDRVFGAVVEYADVVFVTEREASSLFGTDSPDPVGIEQLVVVTRGPDGATVFDDVTYDHDGFGVGAVDTSGAGDAFAAGFLAVWLDGGGVDRALEFGNACGALASEHVGARTTPARESVEAFLAEQG